MRIAVSTPIEGFRNDIGDVVRLFYGEGAAVTPEEQADAHLVHLHKQEDGQWTEHFILTAGSDRAENTLGAPVFCGGLEEKRQLKRLIKRCCYQLFKDFTGRQPAWGSLTGI